MSRACSFWMYSVYGKSRAGTIEFINQIFLEKHKHIYIFLLILHIVDSLLSTKHNAYGRKLTLWQNSRKIDNKLKNQVFHI